MHAHARARGLGTSLNGVRLRVLFQMTLPSLSPELQDFFRCTESVEDRPIQPVLCGRQVSTCKCERVQDIRE